MLFLCTKLNMHTASVYAYVKKQGSRLCTIVLAQRNPVAKWNVDNDLSKSYMYRHVLYFYCDIIDSI